jgi:hypothetical protein
MDGDCLTADLFRDLIEVEDLLFPQLSLSAAERVLYYHILRHTRLVGKQSVQVSLSALAQATAMSEFNARKYIRVLHDKECVIMERS